MLWETQQNSEWYVTFLTAFCVENSVLMTYRRFNVWFFRRSVNVSADPEDTGTWCVDTDFKSLVTCKTRSQTEATANSSCQNVVGNSTPTRKYFSSGGYFSYCMTLSQLWRLWTIELEMVKWLWMKCGEWGWYKWMWNVISYSPEIQLQELKDIAKETSMRAGCHILIEDAISERVFRFAFRIILVLNCII
jgi:hypothetical protein